MKTSMHLFCNECERELNIAEVRQQQTSSIIEVPGQPQDKHREFLIRVDICQCAGGKARVTKAAKVEPEELVL